MGNNKKNSNGITLIALVVTIIVLLILAGIAINSLTGDNSILVKAGEAKEKTEIENIKEQAELVKASMNFDVWSGKIEKLKQSSLIIAIHKEFKGSSHKGNKVITSNNKYDIIVDRELNISVVKHEESSEGDIILEYSARPQANGVYIDVTSTDDSVPTYEEYAMEILQDYTNDPDLKEYTLTAINDIAIKEGRIPEGQSLSWADLVGEADKDKTLQEILECNGIDECKEVLISAGYVDHDGYEEKYPMTITCTKENQTIDTAEGQYAEFWIEESGEYTIIARSSDEKEESISVKVLLINPSSVSLLVGRNITLNVEGTEESLIWSIADENIVSNSNGILSGITKGTTTITVTNEEGNAVSNICEVNVQSIEIGDFVRYTPPSNGVDVYWTETGTWYYRVINGYNSFRVLNKNNDGSIDLIGYGISGNSGRLSFKGALGYNNGVYTLNKVCSDLFKDETKGITARSIKLEDITSKFNQTAKNRLIQSINDIVISLSPDENVVKNLTDNTVKYSNGKTYYPDLFQYEEDGMIEDVSTSGLVKRDESYAAYGGATSIESPVTSDTKPESLTVPITELRGFTFTSSDFVNNGEKYQEMFYKENNTYYLANRCIACSPSVAWFSLCSVGRSDMKPCINSEACVDSTGYSGGSSDENVFICPVIHVPADVQITPGKNAHLPVPSPNSTPHTIK